MEMDCLKGDWGLPSIDLKCLHVMTYAQFVGAPIQFSSDKWLWKNLQARYPVFRTDQCVLKNSDEKVIEYLKEQNYNADTELTDRERADALAYSALVEEKLLPAMLHTWWMDAQNHTEFSRPWFSKTFHFPFNYILPGHIHRTTEERLYCTRGRVDVLPEELSMKVFKDGKECLTLLSEKLDNNEFFFGKSPTSLDALIFSYLASLVRIPFPNNPLQDHLKTLENLWLYSSRILQRYFPSTPQEEEEEKRKKEKEQEENLSGNPDNDPHKLRNAILSVAVALTALVGYSLLSGLIQLEFVNDNTEDVDDVDDDHRHGVD